MAVLGMLGYIFGMLLLAVGLAVGVVQLERLTRPPPVAEAQQKEEPAPAAITPARDRIAREPRRA